MVETDSPYLAPVPHRGQAERTRPPAARRCPHRRAPRARDRCARHDRVGDHPPVLRTPDALSRLPIRHLRPLVDVTAPGPACAVSAVTARSRKLRFRYGIPYIRNSHLQAERRNCAAQRTRGDRAPRCLRASWRAAASSSSRSSPWRSWRAGPDEPVTSDVVAGSGDPAPDLVEAAAAPTAQPTAHRPP